MEYLQYFIDNDDVVICGYEVLNLIINGIPSIQKKITEKELREGFKPYYKWNTFNTKDITDYEVRKNISFKPYYKWNTFNTLDLYKDIDFVVS